MKRLVLVPLLLLAGCINKPPSTPPPPTVEQLRAEHRYAAALQTLDATASQTSDYAQRREALQAEADAYQATLLEQLNELTRQQSFAEAERRIDEAQRDLPPSTELDRFANNLHAAAAHYRQRTLDDIVLLRSATLSKEQPLYRALEKAASSAEQQALVARQRADTEYFADQLAQLGARAFSQNDFGRAVQYLGQANQLAPSEELAQQLKRAERSLAASKQKRQTARSTEREQHYRELTTALQQNMQQSDYVAARAQMEQLESLGIRGDEVDAQRVRLEKAIEIFVARESDAGNRLYSEGHLEEALVRWRRAAALNPTPQLTERIEKAQRFIDRLEELRTRQ